MNAILQTNIFQSIFCYKNVFIHMQFSHKFIPKYPVNNNQHWLSETVVALCAGAPFANMV